LIAPADDDKRARRLLESTITLSPVGQGGTTTHWTTGGMFGPGTRIGIDTTPLSSQSHLQHVLLHGHLVSIR